MNNSKVKIILGFGFCIVILLGFTSLLESSKTEKAVVETTSIGSPLLHPEWIPVPSYWTMEKVDISNISQNWYSITYNTPSGQRYFTQVYVDDNYDVKTISTVKLGL